MKNKFILCFLGLLFLFINVHFYSAEVTGETVSGEVVSQPVTMNITITTISLPSLTLLNPENETYLTAKNLLLNFVVTNQDNTSFNLDGGSNTTITSNSTFNTTEGAHTLFLYAENVQGTTEKTVTFTVNSTKFIILYNEYAGSLKGISTNFNQSSYEDIQNLSDIILENTDWGKIEFNETINLTNDLVFNDNLLDLDNHTNISNNRIELNSTAIPNFNKSATLYLYNLTFTTPRILRDGSVCPITICTQESFSGGILKFNVTQFTIYSAEETPSDVVIGGGGGPVASGPVVTNLEIDPGSISIKLVQGEELEESFTIKNIGDEDLTINLENAKLKNLLSLSETDFILKPGEKKTIILKISAPEDIIPDLYIGKLIATGGSAKEEILVFIEVESKEALLDVKIAIPYNYQYILPGEDVLGKIEFFNLGGGRIISVSVDYIIKDSEGKEIIFENEIIELESQIKFTKSFKIPQEAKFGEYVFYVKTTYEEKVASASALFNVGERPFIKKRIVLYSIIILIALLIFFIILYYKSKKKSRKMPFIRKVKKAKKHSKKISEHHLEKKKFIEK